MKKLFLPLIFLSSLLSMRAQSLQPQVIGAAGSSLSSAANNARLAYTVGESVTPTQNLASVSLGQGFHNGVLLTVDTDNPQLAQWGLKVYPNPTSQWLFVEFSDVEKQIPLQASVWDAAGRRVLGLLTLDPGANNAVDVSSLPAGAYVLCLQAEHNRMLSLQFVKAD